MEATEEMVAGRELDVLVAEKIMGETVYPDHGASNMHGVTPYSTDIAAAMRVAECMQRRDGPLTLRGSWGGKAWSACFGHQRYSSAETPAVAICLAALELAADIQAG